jgi:predicted nucleic-acid-binding protein
MNAVDTNVIVRLVAADDARQLSEAESFIADGAFVPHIALVEAIWTLQSVYDRTAAQLADTIETLLNHESLVVQDASVVAHALELFRERPKLGFSDCLILEIARSAGHLPLGTFDRDLSKLPGAAQIGGRRG